MTEPTVLFLCTHNAGRSQMALGYFTHFAGDGAVAWSGGSEPGDRINPSAVEAMAEVGIDITGNTPRKLDWELAEGNDVVVSMGCGDACPYVPGTRYDDWKLTDPAGQPIEVVREVRDEIRGHVEALLAELLPTNG
jgi:arsenate reductase (thioredoxin)